MIDEQKIIGLLQAKALNCLDPDDNAQLQQFIDEGHVFPWDDLGVYEYTASLLPISLELETPDVELKDKVALRLIKLRDELQAKKSLEEEELKAKLSEEIIEEEFDDKSNDFESIEEPYVEPPIEIESSSVSELETVDESENISVVQSDTSEIEEVLSESVNSDESTFNLEDSESGFNTEPTHIEENFNESLSIEESTVNLEDDSLPDIESGNVVEPDQFDELKTQDTEAQIENLMQDSPIETTVEDFVEGPKIESPAVEEVNIASVMGESNINEVSEANESVSETMNLADKIEEKKEVDKTPDFTKRSVAEKVFKTIEQDFDALKYRYEKSERKLTRGQLMSYVLIALLFALLVFSFFKFSADIKLLEREIKSLKNNSTSSLIKNKNIISNFNFFS